MTVQNQRKRQQPVHVRGSVCSNDNGDHQGVCCCEDTEMKNSTFLSLFSFKRMTLWIGSHLVPLHKRYRQQTRGRSLQNTASWLVKLSAFDLTQKKLLKNFVCECWIFLKWPPGGAGTVWWSFYLKDCSAVEPQTDWWRRTLRFPEGPTVSSSSVWTPGSWTLTGLWNLQPSLPGAGGGEGEEEEVSRQHGDASRSVRFLCEDCGHSHIKVLTNISVKNYFIK